MNEKLTIRHQRWSSRNSKHLFEETVGPDCLKYLYETQYRLGRMMFGLALRGKNSDYEMNEIDDIVQERATIRAPEMLLIKDRKEIQREENEAFYKELAAQDNEIERKLRYVTVPGKSES